MGHYLTVNKEKEMKREREKKMVKNNDIIE